MVIGSGPAGQKAAIQAAKAGTSRRRHRARPAGRRLVRAHRHHPEQVLARTRAAPARAARGSHGRTDPVAARWRGRDHRRARRLHGGAARAQPHPLLRGRASFIGAARARHAPHRRLAARRCAPASSSSPPARGHARRRTWPSTTNTCSTAIRSSRWPICRAACWCWAAASSPANTPPCSPRSAAR